MPKYVAFLRGINVSGHHKVPMAELRSELEKLNCSNVVTILNSGNVIFDSSHEDIDSLEQLLSDHLEKKFTFSIPTLLRRSEVIHSLIEEAPFSRVEVTKDTRLYASFLSSDVSIDMDLPWSSDDHSYQILEYREKMVLSVLDLAISQTPKAMEALELRFGKGITTRNWNTIKRIGAKL